VTSTLLDTSFFIAVERRDLQALERFSEMLEMGDEAAISTVTLVELLASPALSPQRRAFYERLRSWLARSARAHRRRRFRPPDWRRCRGASRVVVAPLLGRRRVTRLDADRRRGAAHSSA
jgi:predicted nucleic acid-binding protein